jgi:hypothetical protein
LLEVLFEGGAFGGEGSGEGWSPALFEDRELEAFDVAVGGWSAGSDAAVLDCEGGEFVGEVFGAELRAIVGDDRAEFPAGCGELCRDAVNQALVWRAIGLRSEVCSSAQA